MSEAHGVLATLVERLTELEERFDRLETATRAAFALQVGASDMRGLGAGAGAYFAELAIRQAEAEEKGDEDEEPDEMRPLPEVGPSPLGEDLDVPAWVSNRPPNT
jgi:hypothetical protein